MTARTDLLRRAPHAALPRRGEKVLCAVSGGLDSMCLLRMLEAWGEERGGQVLAPHFNHRPRAPSPIHLSQPTRLRRISFARFRLEKKK